MKQALLMLALLAGCGPSPDSRVKVRLHDRANPGRLNIVELGMQDYVRHVVEAETEDGRSNTAYVRALARVIWSYARHPRHKGEGYDFCNYTHCQLYKGPAADDAKFRQILKNLRPLPGPARHFSRCCGGQTDEADSIWGQGQGASISCALHGEALCGKDPLFRWEARLPRSNFLKAASKALNAEVLGLAPQDKTPGGRIRRFQAELPSGAKLLEAHEFYSAYGQLFGWRDLHSLAFEIRQQGDWLLVNGKGFGHGIGLCQTGALNLARKGWDEDKILGFYFPDLAQN